MGKSCNYMSLLEIIHDYINFVIPMIASGPGWRPHVNPAPAPLRLILEAMRVSPAARRYHTDNQHKESYLALTAATGTMTSRLGDEPALK